MTGYTLLDFGGGEKLERLGGGTVVRPAPAAVGPRQLPDADWAGASLRFTRENGWAGAAPPDWRVSLAGVVMALRPAAGGGVGFFPEHAAAADAVVERLASCGLPPAAGALNLFAHTGQLTLRLAAAGIAVVHVDSSVAAVKMARRNVVLSGLEGRPVRWIADDAGTFLRREEKRGRRYALVVADPPAYGRGGKGGVDWKLTRDLPEFLALCARVLTPGGRLCLTCHGAGWTAERLSGAAREVFPAGEAGARELSLATPDGRRLPAGVMVLVQKGR